MLVYQRVTDCRCFKKFNAGVQHPHLLRKQKLQGGESITEVACGRVEFPTDGWLVRSEVSCKPNS